MIKPWPFYKIMIGFILKANSYKISKFVLCLVYFLYVDSDLGYWYIIWKLSPEAEKWIWKTPFALCFWGWGLHAKPELAWGQVNWLGLQGNYVSCLVVVVILMELGETKR